VFASCVGPARRRGDALYHTDNGELAPPAAVAELSGLVQTVDGQSVPAGRRFELLPGCHIVTNSTRWTASDLGGSRSATLAPRRFAIFMRAGYRYAIRIEEGIWSGTSGTVKLIAEELGPDGKVTRQIAAGEPCSDS
jgi:hypothetical protein